MTRVSRIPYHQNVYDLLQMEPGVCPDAARMIADHEAQHGPLPASVREWYLIPNIAPLNYAEDEDRFDHGAGTVWDNHLQKSGGEGHNIRCLESVLLGCAGLRSQGTVLHVEVLNTVGFYSWTYALNIDGSNDPEVWIRPDLIAAYCDLFRPHMQTFSSFLWKQITTFYLDTGDISTTRRCVATRPYANGLWLRTPDEPFEPAVIDYLTEQLGEPERTPRPGNVTTYTYRPNGGIIRVTADEPSLGGGLSAWWVHANTPQRLVELARLIMPFGTLRDTLRADTDAAREVLMYAKGSSTAS